MVLRKACHFYFQNFPVIPINIYLIYMLFFCSQDEVCQIIDASVIGKVWKPELSIKKLVKMEVKESFRKITGLVFENKQTKVTFIV